MALQYDQLTNTLSVNDTVNANSSLNLVGQGTGAVNLKGTGQNLITNSTSIATTWSYINLTTTTGQTDPFGGTNAVLINDGVANGDHKVQQQIFATTNATTTTFSVYLKAGTANFGGIYFYNTGQGVFFNLTTGAFVNNIVSAPASYTSTNIGNGWWRYSITTNVYNSSGSYFQIFMSETGSSTTGYTGTNQTIYISSPQFEIGPAPTTYTPTTTAVYGTPSLSFSGVAGVGLQSDGSLYVSPAGTGAIQAQATTSTATGGNARGSNAVDWQTARGISSAVASGTQSFVGGGYSNSSTGSNSVVVGGISNGAAGAQSFIGGGNQNSTGSGSIWSSVVGGYLNYAQGYFNFIGGGQNNTGTSSSAVTTATTTIGAVGTTLYLTGTNSAVKAGQLVMASAVTAYFTFANTGISTGTSSTASAGIIGNGANTATGTIFTPLGTITNQFIAGQVLTGTGVTAGTYIASNNAVTFTGSISGTTLTYSSGSSPNVGMLLVGTGITANTYITANSYPTYTVSQSSASTGSISIYGLSYTVSSSQYVNANNTVVTGIAYTLPISQSASSGAGITVSFYTPHGVVVGGGNNTANGSYSFVGGGGDEGNAAYANKAIGDWSTVPGGRGNIASGNYSVVAGGAGNLASGAGSFIGGGGLNSGSAYDYSNLATALDSSVVGGEGNQATNNWASIGGGLLNLATGPLSTIPGGAYGTTRGVNGYMAFPASYNPFGGGGSPSGWTQKGLLVLANTTTSATTANLTSVYNTTSGTTQIVLPTPQAGTVSVITFRALVSAHDAGLNSAGWEVKGVISQASTGISSTALVGTPTVTLLGASAGATANGWATTSNVVAVADTTYGCLQFQVTGVAANTIRWSATVETNELGY